MTAVTATADTATADTGAPDKGEKVQRADRLEAAVRSKSRGGFLTQLPADQLLLILGGVLMPLGILAVFLGWYGTARTPFLFEQIPYVASGGFAGVALVLTGGFLYFGSWLARQVVETREQNARLLVALENLQERVAEAQWTAASGAGAAAAGAMAASPASARTSKLAAASDNGTLVATQRGSMVHLPTCGVVANRDKLRQIDPETAIEKGFVPCKICAPLS